MSRINFNKIKNKNLEKTEKFKTKRVHKEKEPKEPKIRKKRFRFWYWLFSLIVLCAIVAFVAGVGFCYYIVTSAPEFDTNQMFEKEASRLFDSKGNIFATLGTEQRQKVTYNELPEVLIDAIIATEDSRFFQHKGFDLPRFVKAAIGQVLGQNSGGASTLTMQLSKLAFTSTDAEGFKGIVRKFTDIYMSVFKIEKNYTKEEIIEYYVNTPCLGGSIYGVEQASQYYFDKSVGDLNLVEASLIAGLFQSPNGYNPYVNPNDANDRKNTVLYLMKRHGYITQEEYDVASSIAIKDVVSDATTSINEYQGFIDTVVQEVIDKTGNNPYDVPMDIYTTMVTSKQNIINKFYKNYKFRDRAIEVGIGVINVKNGAIVAVGAGRNKKSAMTLNYATQINRHPGSTIKPIMDYGPAIEYENLSTYGPFLDEKTPYGSSYMRNFSGGYSGFMTMKKCLQKSINTCALQAFNMTSNEQKMEFITSLGIQPEKGITVIPKSYAIGAFNGVSPVQLAGAYSAFASGGYYTKPYSFTTLIYRETEEEYENDITRKRVMKAQTAYMLTSVLVGATSSRVHVSGTQVATKTGTTSYDTNLLKKYGLNSSTIPDSWTSSYSPDYAMAIWYGYDELDSEHVKKGWILPNGHASSERLKIQGYLANKIYEKNSTFKNPGGLSSSRVELETIPAQRPSTATPSSLKGTFTFISGTEPSEVSQRFSQLSNPSKVSHSLSGSTLDLSWDSPGIPSAISTDYLTEYFNNGYTIWAKDYLNKRLKYNKNNIGNFGFAIYLTSGESSTYVGWTSQTSYTINLNNYTGIFDGVIIKSAYSIFKANASTGYKITFNASGGGSSKISYSVSMNGLNSTIAKGSTFTPLAKKDISSIKANDDEIKLQVSDLTVSISSISKSDDASWNGTSSNITETTGTYKITYLISFDYLSHSGISKTVTQTVTVN